MSSKTQEDRETPPPNPKDAQHPHQQRRRDDVPRRAEADLLDQLIGWFEAVAGKNKTTRKPPVVQLLTFADTIKYFTDEHPGDPGIQAGALLRQPHPSGSLIFQVFLDATDQISVDTEQKPYGRTLVAVELDHELADKFGDVDLVIFR